ncbi:MAG: hypothetical protein K2W96_20275 [Gemmataceae bacterium]|nr:hypothetical protein [Gemmataceae bacterium]
MAAKKEPGDAIPKDILRIITITRSNPERLGMEPVQPSLLLAGLVHATEGLVESIRRFLPVPGSDSAFEGRSVCGALIERVGPALDAVESWINPQRLAFDDLGRRDLDRICGVPQGTIEFRMLLNDTLSALVSLYDDLLSCLARIFHRLS